MMKLPKIFYILRVIIAIAVIFGIWSHFRIHFVKKTARIKVEHRKDHNLKYILQWTLPDTIPFVYMGKGRQTFIDRKCAVQNCFITPDRNYFDDIRKFDAIVFHGPELHRENIKVPSSRSPEQRYIFVSWESSDYYPICDEKYDDFFNWTWTYKLNSDASLYYLKIRDKKGDVIGPKRIMHWKKKEEIMKTRVNTLIKIKLRNKKKAAAWMVSNCNSLSRREEMKNELEMELQKYGLSVDVYGKCGTYDCPVDRWTTCLRMIESDYYFYLAFENSFSEDYVTEKILHGLKYYTVPVVYGAANYTRFVPDGAYLDIRQLGAKEVAKRMYNLMRNRNKYYDYFKWHNFYSYHHPDEAPDLDDYCQICAKLHNKDLTEKRTVYKDFRKWWNNLDECRSEFWLFNILRFFN